MRNYRRVEGHTTGLPFINYLPDNLAYFIARRFSKRVENNESWVMLLRKGIRGGTEREIMKILRIRSAMETRFLWNHAIWVIVIKLIFGIQKQIPLNTRLLNY